MEPLEKFGQEIRAWLEASCPASMRTRPTPDEVPWGGRRFARDGSDRALWLERMGERGFTAPMWPKEYGGGGLSREENAILTQEMRRINARQPLVSFGISMLGPVLLEFGSEAQKHRFIPDIVKGNIRWCQGYSEPGAGSDLAGLQTRAVPDGDRFIVNGQKVWTSYADSSDWMFCLVRTKLDGAKQEGISFLLFDMEGPGVSVAPLLLISGASPFCEVFIQDVSVPKDQLVGTPGGGWTIAKRLLQHERTMISTMGGGGTSRGTSLPDLARKHVGADQGRIADPLLRDKVTTIELDRLAFALTNQRSAAESRAGQGPGHAASMFKYYGTELNKRKYEVMMSLVGASALGWEGAGFEDDELGITREWLRSKGNSIEGGTSEIQLNVIAKRVLQLPD
jgi:alkylation response protein AidB-like acyl-CoA dehydrogenase